MSIGSIAYSLGRFIDPEGHAKDDRQRVLAAALRRGCPFCGVLPLQECRTLSTGRTTTPHSARRG